jgi:hypothetical protein
MKALTWENSKATGKKIFLKGKRKKMDLLLPLKTSLALSAGLEVVTFVGPAAELAGRSNNKTTLK